MANEIKFNSGYNSCNDQIAIVKNETVPRDLTTLESLSKETAKDSDLLYVDSNGVGKTISVKEVLNPLSYKADWNAKEDEDGFIKNKPGVDNLEEDMVSLYTVGGVRAGHRFEKGTSLRDIVEMMFSLEHNGYMVKFCTSVFPEELTDTQLAELDVENNRVKISTDEFSLGKTVTVSPKNEYFVLAIPREKGTGAQTTIKEIVQAGFPIDYNEYVARDYILYYYGPSYVEDQFILKVMFDYFN